MKWVARSAGGGSAGVGEGCKHCRGAGFKGCRDLGVQDAKSGMQGVPSPGWQRPGVAPAAGGAAHLGGSGRSPRAMTPAGPEPSIPQPVRTTNGAEPTPCPSVPVARRRSTSVRAAFLPLHPPSSGSSYPRAACPGCCRLLRCPTTVHPCAMSPWRALDGPLNPPEKRSCGVPPACPWGAQHSASALLSPCSPTGPAGCLAAVWCSPHPREVGCKGLRVLLVSTVLLSVA